MTPSTARAARHTMKWPSFRCTAARAARFLTLLLATAFLGGCPFPVGDPITRSQIKNDTAAPIQVELTLDKNYGTSEWVEEELNACAARGEGVELITMDPARYAGTYQVAPSAVLIVNESMGTGPYHHLTAVAVTQGAETTTFSGEKDIIALFQRVEGNLWEFKVTEAR